MADYCQSEEFRLIPKRPSFRMTPGPHCGRSYDVPRSPFNNYNQMNNRRQCYNANSSPPFMDDHRRLYSYPPPPAPYQNPKGYYMDRFWRTHDPAMPMYYSNGYSNNRNQSGYRGSNGYNNYGRGGASSPVQKIGYWRKPNLKQVTDHRFENDQQMQHFQQGYQQPSYVSSSSTSSQSNELTEASSSSSRESQVNGDGNQGKEEGSEQGSPTSQHFEGTPSFPCPLSPPTLQFAETADHIYNYDSPEVFRRMESCPPMVRPLHYHEEAPVDNKWGLSNEALQDELMKIVLQPMPNEHVPARVLFNDSITENDYADNKMIQGSMEDHFFLPPPPPPHPVHPPNLGNLCPYSFPVDFVHPSNQMMYLHQNMPPEYLEYHPNGSYATPDHNLMEVAKMGFMQFKNDYENDHVSPAVHHPEGENMQLYAKPRVSSPEDLQNVEFMIDSKYFEDTRDDVKVFDGIWVKEYKLFRIKEEYQPPIRDFILELLNVNEVDWMEFSEICGSKMLPRSVSKWPLEGIRNWRWNQVRKHIVNFQGNCTGHEAGGHFNSGQFNGKCGGLGLEPLVNFFNSYKLCGTYPLGASCFVGMNMYKLVRDLELEKPITASFAGPLHDRNLVHDDRFTDVARGFPEYDLPYDVDGNNTNPHDWVLQYRITRKMFQEYSLDVLLFIFYTFTQDALQMLAAKEMHVRVWKYHKILQIWISPCSENVDLEWIPGIYKYFHYKEWKFKTAQISKLDGVLEETVGEVYDALWE